jgi:hypothetical protein
LTRLWILFAAAGSCFLSSPALGQQDTFSGVERIVAVGDVHGDCAQLVKALRAAGVIDANENWIAGKTHLVQTGDVLDRGPDSSKAMDLLMKLESQAADANGAVHALIGNHEAMVLMGDLRYVHEGETKAFGGEEEYAKAMSAEGKYGKWIRSHNAAVKINDLLFAHAGITSYCSDMSLTELNKAIRRDLATGDANGMTMNSAGPLWDRTLVMDDEGLVAKDLDAVFKALGAARMVVGHTVDRDGIQTRAGGRLIRIDVGMSGAYGGPAACLLVEKGVFYEVREGKEKRKLPLEAASQPASSQPASRPAALCPVPALWLGAVASHPEECCTLASRG